MTILGKNKTRCSVFVLILFVQLGFSQRYTSFMSGQLIPMYYNPAFAGYTGYTRVSVAMTSASVFLPTPTILNFVGLGFSNLNKGYFSVDHYFNKEKLGASVSFVSNPWYPINLENVISDGSHIQRLAIELAISKKIQLNKKSMLTFAGGYGRSEFLQFYGEDNRSPAPIKNPSFNEGSFGALIHSNKYYCGYSLRYYTGVTHQFDSLSQVSSYNYSTRFVSIVQASYVFKKKSHNFSPSVILQVDHDLKSLLHDLQINLQYRRNNFFIAFGGSIFATHCIAGYQGQFFRIYYAAGLSFKNPAEKINMQEITATYVLADYTKIKKKVKK